MLSPPQYITVICLSIISHTLSFVCSSAVIIASAKDTSRSVYQRLVLAISAVDAFSSFAGFFHPFMLPRYTREAAGLIWASGNDATCSLAGFSFTLGYPLVSIFSFILSAYFLCKVRYNTPDEVFSKNCVRPVTAVALLVCVGLAVVGSVTGSYAPRVYHNVCTFGDCAIGEMDQCEDVFETGLSWYLGWAHVGLIVLPALLALIMTVCVYATVRAKLIKGRQFVFGGDREQREHQNDKLKAVRTQAILYSLAYWNSFFCYFVFGVVGGDDFLMIEKESTPFYYSIQVLVWTFVPLQGFVNAVVYTRPRYLQWRKLNPTKSRYFALRNAITFEPVSTTAHLRSTAMTQQDNTNQLMGSGSSQHISSFIAPFRRASTNENMNALSLVEENKEESGEQIDETKSDIDEDGDEHNHVGNEGA